jgi:hypothetical protein
MHGFLLAHPALTSKEDLTMMALLHYGLYSVTNSRRRIGPLHEAEAFDAVQQGAMEGAKGHPNATKVWDTRWHRVRANRPIPPTPLLQLDKKTRQLRTLAMDRRLA